MRNVLNACFGRDPFRYMFQNRYSKCYKWAELCQNGVQKVEHKLTFREVVERIMRRYREDVLDEIAEDVEKFVEMKVWSVIDRRAAQCAGLDRIYEDAFYRPDFQKCLEKIYREVVRE